MQQPAGSLGEGFRGLAKEILAPVLRDLELVPVESASPLELRLRGPAAEVVLELSKGHTWQLSAVAAPLRDGETPSESAFMALGFVLEALTGGVETYTPRWLAQEVQLTTELERLKERLRAHGRHIFHRGVDWEEARDYSRRGVARAVAAASGRSRLARNLEAADKAFGRDDFQEARTLYEKLRSELGPAELARLQKLTAHGQ